MASKSNGMGLSNFISLEWFGMGDHETKPDKAETSIHEWVNKSVTNHKLNPSITLREGNIEVHGKAASLFYRQGKQIHDVLGEFEKDFHDYYSIFKSNKGELASFGKEQNSFSNALEHIADSETTFEEVRAVILKYKNASKRFGGNGALARKFKEPTTHLLGDYPSGFLSKDHRYFEVTQHVGGGGKVDLPALSGVHKDKVVKMALDIQMLGLELEDLDEKVGPCIDMTDSPLRGFSDEISGSNELMEVLGPFIEHGMVDEDQNAGLLDVLMKRVENLSDALWHYIKNSCH